MRLILIAIFGLLPLASPGQIRIYAEHLDTSKNFLYRGIDNRVRITGITNKDTVSVRGGDIIKKIGKDLFYVRVHSANNYAFVSVGKEGRLGWKKFEVISCEWPESNWPTGAKITQDSLLKIPFLSMDSPADCPTRLSFPVLSFDATIDHADSIIVFPIKGSHFSPDFIRHLETKKDGYVITFDNIRIIAPDGRSYRSPGIVLYLRE